MGKAAIKSTEARVGDLADAFAPVPAQLATLEANVTHWSHVAAALEPMPAQFAMLEANVAHWKQVAAALEPVPAELTLLAAAVDRLADENRALRAELAAIQRALLQIAWGLVAALLGAAAAIIATLA
jgi:hypothetical protein